MTTEKVLQAEEAVREAMQWAAYAVNKDVSKHKRNARNELEKLLQNLTKVPDDDLHHPNTDEPSSHQKLSLGWLRDNIFGLPDVIQITIRWVRGHFEPFQIPKIPILTVLPKGSK